MSLALCETWTAWVRNGVLNARPGASPAPAATVAGPKQALVGFLLQPGAADTLIEKGAVTVQGDPGAVHELIGVMEQFDADFAIVTP